MKPHSLAIGDLLGLAACLYRPVARGWCAGRCRDEGRGFRLTAPVPVEDDLHASVARALDLLMLPPAERTTFPAGHIELSGQAAAKLARLGLKRNWPDLLILHGVLHGIELKRPGGRLSIIRTLRTRRGKLREVEGQRKAFPRLDAAGMRLAVCDSLDAVRSSRSGASRCGGTHEWRH